MMKGRTLASVALILVVSRVPQGTNSFECSASAHFKSAQGLAQHLAFAPPTSGRWDLRGLLVKRGRLAQGRATCKIDRRKLRRPQFDLWMQSDTLDRPEDDDEEERARLEEERAKLNRMFKLGAPDDVSEDSENVPDEGQTASGDDPVSSSAAEETGIQSAPDTDAISRLNRILADGGSLQQVIPQDDGFATDVSLAEARRRLEAEGGEAQASELVGQVADSMEQGMAQSHAAIISAIVSGTTSLLVSVNVPELDPTSRGYNETALYAWCHSIATSLKFLSVSGSPIKVIVQDDAAASAAARAFGGSDCMQIRTLSEAKDGAEIVTEDDAAVLMIAPTNSKGCKVTKEVRQVILQHLGKPIVVLNQCLDAAGPDGKPVGSMPVELKRFEEAYYIQAWALQGQVQRRPAASAAPPQPPRPRRVALSRKFPGSWALYVYEDDDARYELLQTMEKKPSERLVLQLCARALSPKPE